jgi:hypothetical protein
VNITPTGWSLGGVSMSPNGQYMIAASSGVQTVWISNNSGLTWIQNTTIYNSSYPWGGCSIDNTGQNITVGSIGNWVYTSSNGGQTWTQRTNSNGLINTYSSIPSPLNYDSALIMYYTFDTSTVNDRSVKNLVTNNYDFETNDSKAISTVMPYFGTAALYFPEDSFWAQNPTFSIVPSQGVTITCWTYVLPATGSSNTKIWEFLSNSPQLFIYQNKLAFNWKFDDLNIGNTLAYNTWYNFAVTFTSTKVILYLNGSQIYTSTTNIGNFPSSGFMNIGTQTGDGYTTIGYFDEFRVYNRVLSNAEITTLYNATNSFNGTGFNGILNIAQSNTIGSFVMLYYNSSNYTNGNYSSLTSNYSCLTFAKLTQTLSSTILTTSGRITLNNNIINNYPTFSLRNRGIVSNLNIKQAVPTYQTFAFLSVLQINSIINGSRLLSFGNNTNMNDYYDQNKFIVTCVNNNLVLETNQTILNYGPIILNTPYIMSGYYDGSGFNFGINAFYQRLPLLNTFTITKLGIGINSYNNNEFIQSTDWGEILVYSNITTANRQLVEGYLAWKWGLTQSIPLSHPYYPYTYLYYQNYTIANNPTANILPKLINLTAVGNNKYYDGTTVGSLASYSLSGIIAGDIVDISNIYTANFESIFVKNNIIIDISNFALYGASYYNYYINNIYYTTGNILGSNIIINWYSLGKVYDRNTFAPVIYTISGLVPIDVPYVNVVNIWTANYSQVNAGLNIPININNIFLSGYLAPNYTISSSIVIYGQISKRYLYVTGNDKNYDRSILATVSISNIIGNDSIKYFAQYDDYNVNNNKNIYVAISGVAVLPNYLDIDPTLILYYSFDLNTFNGVYVANVANNNPVYNNAQLTNTNMISSNSKIGSGCLYTTTYDYSQYMTNVTLPQLTNNGFSISVWIITPGNFRQMLFHFVNGSYEMWFQSAEGGFAFWIRDTSQNVIKAFYLGFSNASSWMNIIWTIQYNSTYNNSTHNLYINGVFQATQISLYPTTNGYFYGNILGGYNQPSYVPTWLGYLDDFRVYNRVLSQTDVTNLYNYTFMQVNINNNISYQLFNNLTTANIFQRYLHATFTAVPKVYNTYYSGQSTYTISGLYAGDIIDISNIYTTTFNSINVVNNTSVYINNVTLTGANYFNYVIDSSAVILGSVIPATLNPNFYCIGKVYNRNSYAPLIYNLSGMFDQDVGLVDISQIWMANYRNVNAGNNYIDISNIKLYGIGAFNYTIPNYTTISGIISKRYLYVTGNDKNYDRSMLATVSISNIVGNDTVSYFAQYDD